MTRFRTMKSAPLDERTPVWVWGADFNNGQPMLAVAHYENGDPELGEMHGWWWWATTDAQAPAESWDSEPLMTRKGYPAPLTHWAPAYPALPLPPRAENTWRTTVSDLYQKLWMFFRRSRKS